MHPSSLFFPLVLLALAGPLLTTAPAADHNLLLVTIDGLRWQEVFQGADEAYLNTEHGGVPEKDVAGVRHTFATGSTEERRSKLMPFLWHEIAAKGQVLGNRNAGSLMRVANAEWFSYPGYNELLCGFVDPLITSNAPIPNRNITVLEWLNGREGFRGRVYASLTWHVLSATLNVGRSKIPAWVSSQNPGFVGRSARFADIDRWMRDIPIKSRDEHYDGFSFHAAREIIGTLRPRVLYLALGEPDTHAHARRYAAYLDSIQRSDRFVRELWEQLQADPAYRGRTTLLITTDHGRGRTPKDWPNHNKTTPGSEETWLAAIGPGVVAGGEAAQAEPVLSAQVAATVAALLGEDYRAFEPKAAPPVASLVGAQKARAAAK